MTHGDAVTSPHEERAARRDRQAGCLYGLAVGDALGAAVEFEPPGTFEPVTGYRQGTAHPIGPGAWTDDTSMALALAASLADGWDLADQLRRYVQWSRDGAYSVIDRCFDIGGTTARSLRAFETTGSVTNSPGEFDSGNGSIMRLAPVAIRYLAAPDRELAEKASQSSQTTHASRLARGGCIVMAALLKGLMEGHDRAVVVQPAWVRERVGRQAAGDALADEGLLKDEEFLADDDVIEAVFAEDRGPVGSGFVLASLHAAVWAFRGAASFEEAVLAAVNLGDDSDTTGAVCGQLAGACWGLSGIPQPLIDGLQRREMLERALEPLLG